jgi:hypothetical protein
MSQATAEIVGPTLGMLGAAIVLAACLPILGRVLDVARERIATLAPVYPSQPSLTTLRGWHVPTERVTCSAYRPTRRARRYHAGAHRLSGLAPGQRYAPTLNTKHIVRSHAA